MLSRQHQLLAVAVMASLSLSACGKKKDLVSNEPPPVVKTDGKKDAAPDSTLQAQNPGLGGGLEAGTAELPPSKKKQSNNNSNELPPPPALPKAPTRPAPQVQDRQDWQNNEQEQDNAPGSAPRVVDVQPAPDMNSVDHLDNYESQDRGNLSRGNTKRLTGGRTKEGLLYTSASTDTLHESLRARNERVDANSKRLNLLAAAAVTSASLNVNSGNGQAVVTVKFQEGRGEQVYKLSGAMGGSLSSVRSGTTGSQPIDGSLQCLDFDGASRSGLCETMFARLRIGAVGSSGIVNIIFRQSLSGLFFDLPGEYSENPEYKNMHDFIVNSIRGENTRNKIVRSRMSTWEVTNGRSGFTVIMKGANNELLGFSGPLLAPQTGNGVSIQLSRVTNDGDANTRLNLANSVGEAKLIANNGLGQLQVVVKMRKQANYRQDQFAVTFARQIKPVIELK